MKFQRDYRPTLDLRLARVFIAIRPLVRAVEVAWVGEFLGA
jgi:hypothetical protein